ncbi:putative low-complexity protein [Xenococcus sp. PCC 7305]|uniref:pentapeptide repeat-containing protein n=1 Tax=Xenococcus sp. PCC 7305 TaxID=102125 RepID=UPI0002ACDD6B|nr:pentapeptide repeat-containing protein [Xenococcus sp. PCC 7305]ELS03641.1 putative low-complexity protein [Xenococcus sp. PCC 7305]
MASLKNVQKGISRVLTATVLTFGLMLIMFLFETLIAHEGLECGQHPIRHHHKRRSDPKPREEIKGPKDWFFCELENSVMLDALDGFAIIVALFLFLLETPDRTQQAQYEAWQVVDAAHGLKTSYARIQALQDLNGDNVTMKGLFASGADLRNIDLHGADLSNADFQDADLRGANLSNTNLSNANLANADFSNVNLANARLSGSDLSEANFVEANLNNVDFVGAIITDTNFVRANLERAYFGDNNFIKTNLKDANIKKTKFFGVENLSSAQIQSASHWKEAIYDATLTNQLGLG